MFELDAARRRRRPTRWLPTRAPWRPRGLPGPAAEAPPGGVVGALALGKGEMAEALASRSGAGHGDRELATYTNRAVALEALGRDRRPQSQPGTT